MSYKEKKSLLFLIPYPVKCNHHHNLAYIISYIFLYTCEHIIENNT